MIHPMRLFLKKCWIRAKFLHNSDDLNFKSVRLRYPGDLFLRFCEQHARPPKIRPVTGIIVQLQLRRSPKYCLDASVFTVSLHMPSVEFWDFDRERKKKKVRPPPCHA
ncbi:hypothetical protein DL546_001224 [Coniochaeta pulveracea]|uniref:Uncharacterized protein n=1 Tax=Coniochaeta pulveracea TaxID=177199 RepID=A0A420Y672_9PEZI|nr:hypothetical protein DL546_001224 [Coniochaeta pulveracea]